VVGWPRLPALRRRSPLIDVAEPQGRKTFLRDRELASAIRGYYGARTGMLIAFWGILLGLVVALFLWRKAVLAPGPHKAALLVRPWCARSCRSWWRSSSPTAWCGGSAADASGAPRVLRTSASHGPTDPGRTCSASVSGAD